MHSRYTLEVQLIGLIDRPTKEVRKKGRIQSDFQFSGLSNWIHNV